MVPVAMTITHDGFKIRKMLSGINVLEKDWSSDQQRMKPSKKDESYNNCAQHNATMDELSKNLNKMWTHHLLDEKGDLTKQMILEFLDGKQESIISNEEIRFIDCFEEFINQSESHRAPRTITGYKTVKKILENFFDQTGFNSSLNDIDLKFFDRLRNYCFVEKTYRNNMFARIITNIKTIMKWAEDRNYHSNLTYTKFVAPEEEVEVIFLTMDELMRLYNHTFTKETKYLEKVRDIYCFSCYTGLRYSDLANLKHSNIKEKGVFNKLCQFII
jgi:integrase